MPIKFAPLNVPIHRRRQTAALLLWICLLPLSLFVFFYLATYPSWWPFLLLYLLYIYFDVAPEHGGRRIDWVRHWRMWRWFGDYFPVTLKKTVDLDPSRNYVFGYHPHGIISFGALVSIGTEACSVSKVFPGLNIRLLTLSSNFNLPIYRDLLLSLGICSVSRRSCERILGSGPGSALTIVVGGAAESLNAHPGTLRLTLKRRMGFVRVAVRAGADLVPIVAFGENDIFEQVPNERGTRVRAFQKQFQSIFGFTTPFFHGRGVFNYSFGLLPHRRPITCIVGKPIRVEQHDNPPAELVEKYHKEYLDQLQSIWDEHKDRYAKERVEELQFVD